MLEDLKGFAAVVALTLVLILHISYSEIILTKFFGNLLFCKSVCNELFSCRDVDAHVAWVLDRGRCDSNMNLDLKEK